MITPMEDKEFYTLIHFMEIIQKADEDNMYIIFQDPDDDDTILKVRNTEDLFPTITQYKDNFAMIFEYKSPEDFPWYCFRATWSLGEYNREADVITYSKRAYDELMKHLN